MAIAMNTKYLLPAILAVMAGCSAAPDVTRADFSAQAGFLDGSKFDRTTRVSVRQPASTQPSVSGPALATIDGDDLGVSGDAEGAVILAGADSSDGPYEVPAAAEGPLTE